MVIKISNLSSPRKLKAVILSLVVSILLFLIKFGAYLVTDSSAIFSDALESLINIAAASFALVSVLISSKPADRSHPYGHGKIEFVSSGFEGAAIVGAAIVIVYQAVSEFITTPDIRSLGTGIVMIGVATLVNAIVGVYLIRVGKKTSSITLEADGKHLLSDVYSSLGVLVGIILIKVTGLTILDPIIALLVAANILWMGGRLLQRSFGGILDKADEKDNEIVSQLLNSEKYRERVCGFHRLRSRKSGGVTYVDFHLLMPRELDLGHAHDTATEIEERIADALGSAGVMAHIEPCKDKHCIACSITDCKKRCGEQ